MFSMFINLVAILFTCFLFSVDNALHINHSTTEIGDNATQTTEYPLKKFDSVYHGEVTVHFIFPTSVEYFFVFMVSIFAVLSVWCFLYMYYLKR